MLVCGCDVGSTTGKALFLQDSKVISYAIIPCTTQPDRTGQRAIDLALHNANLPSDTRIDYIVGTGYGRVNLSLANENVSEITCHGKGAYYLNPKNRTIIDIGGQDCKVIKLDGKGQVVDFVMNDKCAAGTGRFYEAMARALELTLEELAALSLESSSPAQITSQCSVFAESEVITLLNEGVDLVDIAAGINESIAGRLASLVRKAGLEEEVAISGGCAKNQGLTIALERRLKVSVKPLPMDPQIIGALGAALIARDRVGEG